MHESHISAHSSIGCSGSIAIGICMLTGKKEEGRKGGREEHKVKPVKKRFSISLSVSITTIIQSISQALRHSAKCVILPISLGLFTWEGHLIGADFPLPASALSVISTTYNALHMLRSVISTGAFVGIGSDLFDLQWRGRYKNQSSLLGQLFEPPLNFFISKEDSFWGNLVGKWQL